MTFQDTLKTYEDWKFRLSAYDMALSIINIDKLTVAPPAGTSFRDERTAFLAGELFSIQTDPKILPVLAELKNSEDADSDLRKEAETYEKEINKILSIPKEEYVAFEQALSASYDAWLKAKTTEDYSVFAPHLKGMIEWRKKLYGYRNSSIPLYDQMLDEYEPGTNREFYDRFFRRLKERLVPLIRRVVNANETEHPFTAWTCENDCRTTTKYVEDNLAAAIFSTVHEVGHAWYEHNINPKYDGTILSYGVSSGMHESQSRFCENYLGRSRAFWEANYNSLQTRFPNELSDVTLDQFVRAVNASKPSLVRTEADELTYPLHIMIRYEIEKGLFDGSINPEDLEAVAVVSDGAARRGFIDRHACHAGSAAEGIFEDFCLFLGELPGADPDADSVFCLCFNTIIHGNLLGREYFAVHTRVLMTKSTGI